MLTNQKNPHPLNQKIGIIGGGQLGKMMILEAKKLGFYVITLDPTPNCPSHSISDEHIVAAFDDEAAYQQLAEKADVLTYEFEHIGVDILLDLERKGCKVYPTASSLQIIQNKFSQKTALAKEGVPVPDFMPIHSQEDMKQAGDCFGFPYLLKTCTGGYDGKGNFVVSSAVQINECFTQAGSGKIELMAERFADFEMEISVLACRAIDGHIAVYPVGQNRHIDNILDETRVPADISEQTTHQAMETAYRVMEVFQGVGMFCIEMFVLKDTAAVKHKILVNEVAPRPHNSGHYSIEGCVTSQFEQHIRAITGLPLGDPALLRPAVMRNLLGEPGCHGQALVAGLEEALNVPGVKVHIYGKEQTAPKRKMGHLTVTNNDIRQALAFADKAKNSVKILGLKEQI